MPDLTKFKPDGVTQMRVTRLTGWFVVSGAAITAQAATASSTSGGQQCGVTVSRSGAGDFRFTLHRGYKRLVRFDASVVYPSVGVGPGAATEGFITIPIAPQANFTGATPVAASGTLGLVIVRPSDFTTKTDPLGTCTVTFDIELAEV